MKLVYKVGSMEKKMNQTDTAADQAVRDDDQALQAKTLHEALDDASPDQLKGFVKDLTALAKARDADAT